MNIRPFYWLLSLILSFLLIGCGANDEVKVDLETGTPSAAEALLGRALVAHGWDGNKALGLKFTFRDRDYTYARFEDDWEYTRAWTDDTGAFSDRLSNLGFQRTLNGDNQSVPDTMAVKYGNALNSVIYFATLPEKLTDVAVNLNHDGRDTLKGEGYELLRVHFDEEGGGKDHDDNFLYWINDSTGRIDFLAYDYRVDGGGVRFRSAYNPRIIGGILLQDYINYKAPIGTRLNELSRLWEEDQLSELSRIELVNPGTVHVNWQ